MQLLLELTRQVNKTLIMATHNPEIVPLADKVYRLRNAQLGPINQQSSSNEKTQPSYANRLTA
jgi:ABC-type lipoprotein export system ATPase subunit